MFRPRIRLMGHHRTQFREKADLPVGFPYRFNSSWQYVRGVCRKLIPVDSLYSNEYKLCPSYYQHFSVFIRSGIHSVSALNGNKTISILVQSHLQVHRCCIVRKQPRIRKLFGPDVSC